MTDKGTATPATRAFGGRPSVPGAPAFTCPKCHGVMRTYERGGMTLELCEDCRGIFLDKGELERLIEAEGGGWSGIVSAALDPRS
ncbi:MAG: zf-TFIIB domain-containing protein [Chloroflexi bacterium]|nr:zf-TFIIB domain-containing protein [Chloroflexota bacterium]